MISRQLLCTAAIAGSLLSMGAFVRFTEAGPLTPPGPPGSSSITLNELGAKMDLLGGATAPGYFPPSGEPVFISHLDGTRATTILLEVTGQVQGAISGGVLGPGYAEKKIAVLNVSHEVVSPRDAASGLPTGRRQHKPFVIVKPTDKSSPLLYKALCNNERLTTVRARYYQQNAEGLIVNFYTVELEGAAISGISTSYPNLEQVSFVYERIRWTYEDGGVTHEDDWESPIG